MYYYNILQNTFLSCFQGSWSTIKYTNRQLGQLKVQQRGFRLKLPTYVSSHTHRGKGSLV